jgi:hypothetical protein
MQSINFQKNQTKGEVRNMKNILAHSTARAAVALAIVFGGLTTFTHAADIGTANLQLPVAVQRGNQKVIGAVLARPVLAKGDVLTTVTGVNQFTTTAMSTDLTVASFVPVSTAIAGWTGDWRLAPASDNHYIVEFTSGPNTGLIKRVTGFSALATPSPTSCVVTVDGNLPTIDAGTRFVVRKDHTLASLFGDQTSSSASGITTANSAGSSDQFGIFDSAGKIVRFFLRSTGSISTSGWKDIAARDGVNRNFVRVSMGTGVLMNPITTKNIYLNGEYRGARSKITVSAVNSFLANPYPVAVTLDNSRLADYVTRASSAGSADEVRFMVNGKFVNYFSLSGKVWKLSTARDGASQGTIQIPAGEGFAFKKVGSAGLTRDIAWAPQYLTE